MLIICGKQFSNFPTESHAKDLALPAVDDSVCATLRCFSPDKLLAYSEGHWMDVIWQSGTFDGVLCESLAESDPVDLAFTCDCPRFVGGTAFDRACSMIHRSSPLSRLTTCMYQTSENRGQRSVCKRHTTRYTVPARTNAAKVRFIVALFKTFGSRDGT
jgi:hypothetical protein